MPNGKYICMDCFKEFNELDFVIFSIINITNNGPIYRCDECGLSSFEISIVHIKSKSGWNNE